LLLATVPADALEQIWDAINAEPGQEMTVSLEQRTISLGTQTWVFAIDDFTAARLLAGLDDIGATLAHEADIQAFEARRPGFMPTAC